MQQTAQLTAGSVAITGGWGSTPQLSFQPPVHMSQTLVGVSLNPPPQFITLDNMHAELDVGHFFQTQPNPKFFNPTQLSP
jgi:hypothetical protein